MVAIRSTHGIEAPLSTGGKLLVTSEVIFKVNLINIKCNKFFFGSLQYIDHVVTKANILMDENFKRISRFHQNLMKQMKVE